MDLETSAQWIGHRKKGGFPGKDDGNPQMNSAGSIQIRIEERSSRRVLCMRKNKRKRKMT